MWFQRDVIKVTNCQSVIDGNSNVCCDLNISCSFSSFEETVEPYWYESLASESSVEPNAAADHDGSGDKERLHVREW